MPAYGVHYYFSLLHIGGQLTVLCTLTRRNLVAGLGLFLLYETTWFTRCGIEV